VTSDASATLAPPAPDPRPTIDLHGERTSVTALVGQVWRARSLLVILARKEFHVRYRRASFGMLWALALPLLQSAVLAVIFSRVVRIGFTDHYPVFVLTGMVAWTYFSATLSGGATAIVDGTDLSSRVYFPRAVMPLAQCLTNVYALVITIVIVVMACPFLGVDLGVRIALVVPAAALLVLVAIGFSLVASALHVYFRDVRYLVSAAILLWFYVSPIIYPPQAAPRTLRMIIDANPLTGVLDLFRVATVGMPGSIAVPVVISMAWTLALLVGGTILHSRFDRVFADLL
jgi:ABC-type polysaccharide/polyol phosphate export permease